MTQMTSAHTKRTPAGLLAAALASVCALMLLFAAGASAEATYEFSFGSGGGGGVAGRFNEPAGIAANQTTGNLYVADRNNNRIQEFTGTGDFIQAWGFDVVSSGEDNKPFANEEQRVTIKGVGGTFTLKYGADTTGPIAYNASPAAVGTALNELASINTGGGSVTVTGGPGDAAGTNPYVVTFGGGPLAGGDRAELTIDTTQLALPTGTQLECTGTAFWAQVEGFFDYQWLADGQPISGATSPTYTTTAGDSGKAIQCETAATFTQFSPSPRNYGTNRAYTLTGSAPATAPPLGPATIAAPSGPSIPVGGSGGETLTCNAGSWSNAPASYTFQWYLRSVPLGSPTTTASTSNEITLSESDVAAPADIQCRVTATNAGGSSTMWSDLKTTSPPPPTAGVNGIEQPVATVTEPNAVNPVTTKVNGGAVLEVCKASPPSTDICKAGVAGPSTGQLSRPRGVAVDNSPGGNGAVYVGDDFNYRVQKFTENGTPILMFGGHVDKTTGGKVCTVASGHDCGQGLKNLDTTPGFFGGWPCSSGCSAPELGFDELGNSVAVDENNGNVFVTDPYDSYFLPFESRFQEFDSSGQFLGQARSPVFSSEPKPVSIGVDRESRVYVATLGEQTAVNVFEQPEITPEGTQRGFAERHQIHENENPKEISADPSSDKIWLIDRNANDFESESDHVCGEPQNTIRRAIIAYDHLGHQLDCTVPQGLGQLQTAAGLAVTDSGFAYVTLRGQNTVKAYRLPQESPPAVSGESVSAITTETAKIHGQVNPGFEPTEYTFEYGTSPCSSSSCTQIDGSADVYGVSDVPVELAIGNLEPGTKYFYRVVAKSPLGTVPGAEHTFATFPFIDLTHDSCANVLARKQTGTSGLLDCRAYELASADFTGGYDVVSELAPGQTPFDGHPDATDKVLYAVRDGGIPGTGNPTNRGPDPYVATRGADGWTTRYVGIPADGTPSTKPFSSSLLDADAGLGVFAFGGAGICSPCFEDGSAGIPVHMLDGSLVQGMKGSIPQLGAVPAGFVGNPMSADGSHLVFGSTSQFEPAGIAGEVTIYDRDLATGTTQVASTMPNGSAIAGGEVGELDISADGSRIVVAKKVTTDSAGNTHWHPYMHVGAAAGSVDLAPGTTTGVLYDGMSADGTKVFYTTKDELVGADSDESADLYEVEVTGGGPIVPKLISVGTGGPSNDDGCAPVGAPTSWNAISGSGKCDAVGLAGGAGVAGDGTVYFLSPELLAGAGKGTSDQPNLFVVRPGGSPEFVATVDSSVGKTPPPPPLHPIVNESLVTGLSGPESLAVDQSNGDIFVAERANGTVDRFDKTGAAKDYTEGPDAGGNELTGQELGSGAETQIAIDNHAASPLDGSLYVTNNGNAVYVYTTEGEKLGEITGFGEACGVAVDQGSGAVYVGDYNSEKIWRFLPTSGGPVVTNANYTITSIKTEPGYRPCQVAADTAGQVYASAYSSGPLRVFDASEFGAGAPVRQGADVTAPGAVPPSNAIYTDPSNDDLYVETGSQVVVFNSSQEVLREFGAGKVSAFGGIAVDGGAGALSALAHHAYAVNGSNIVEFGIAPDVYEPIDDPMVLNAVADNEVHRWSDFQTSANGHFALLGSSQPLQGSYDNAGYRMVYRYDAAGKALACVSCLTTEGLPTSDASLAAYGLGITEDGRAFFGSDDQLVMRDTNAKEDAYEWEGGTTRLISTGFSNAPSSLLTVTADGKDAYFFTRETIVGNDHNGQAMKLYDAREGGGFFELPASPPCAASDECHGAGTQAAPPPPIGTHEGTGGNARKGCRKGFVKKHGKCVKKRKHHHREAGHGRRGSR